MVIRAPIIGVSDLAACEEIVRSGENRVTRDIMGRRRVRSGSAAGRSPGGRLIPHRRAGHDGQRQRSLLGQKQLMTLPDLVGDRAASVALSPSEIQRYARHLIMPEVAMAGQKRLKAA